METTSGEWRWGRTAHLPQHVLVVASRTEYDSAGWEEVKAMLVPGMYKLLTDPNIIGISAKLDEPHRIVWSTSAWPNYNDLERCVRTQIDWLTQASHRLQHNIRYRHNAYRMMRVKDLPLSWEQVETLVNRVREVSPLGADAFPELTKLLGLDQVS